jgi:hypothetical protein
MLGFFGPPPVVTVAEQIHSHIFIEPPVQLTGHRLGVVAVVVSVILETSRLRTALQTLLFLQTAHTDSYHFFVYDIIHIDAPQHARQFLFVSAHAPCAYCRSYTHLIHRAKIKPAMSRINTATPTPP